MIIEREGHLFCVSYLLHFIWLDDFLFYLHSQLVCINSAFTPRNCRSVYFLFKCLVHIATRLVILLNTTVV